MYGEQLAERSLHSASPVDLEVQVGKHEPCSTTCSTSNIPSSETTVVPRTTADTNGVFVEFASDFVAGLAGGESLTDL